VVRTPEAWRLTADIVSLKQKKGVGESYLLYRDTRAAESLYSPDSGNPFSDHPSCIDKLKEAYLCGLGKVSRAVFAPSMIM